MIFGRRESELRAELAAAREKIGDFDEVRVYVPFAKQIHEQIGTLAANGVGVEEALTESIRNVSMASRQKTVQKIFDTLPLSEQLGRLESVYGDEEFRTYLENQRQRELRRIQRVGALSQLVETVQEERRVDLTTLPIGRQIVVGLYPEDIIVRSTDAGGSGIPPAARTITGRITDEHHMHVLNDKLSWRNRSGLTEAEYNEQEDMLHYDHAIIELGSAIDTSNGFTFVPILYPDTKAAQKVHGTVDSLRLEVGTVTLDGLSLFGN